MSSCFFIGHRETMGDVYPQLEAVIEQHITQFGVREFIVGNYGGFDRVAAQALTAAKVRHPEITLLLRFLTILLSGLRRLLQSLTAPTILPAWNKCHASSPSTVPIAMWWNIQIISLPMFGILPAMLGI